MIVVEFLMVVFAVVVFFTTMIVKIYQENHPAGPAAEPEPQVGYLLLEAVEYNMGKHGPGDWDRTTWTVNTNGIYRVEKRYLPMGEEPARIEHSKGEMGEHSVDYLKSLLKQEWKDRHVYPNDCEGVAWSFRHYSPGGRCIQSDGPDYIFGHTTLQGIAGCLLAYERRAQRESE